MDSVPDAIVQHILSQMNNARDIACCNCVSKRWKDSVPYLPSLYFPRNAFEGFPMHLAEASIDRMITSAAKLEELVVYCPFSASSLASWLSLKCGSLRRLELRMDSILDRKPQPQPQPQPQPPPRLFGERSGAPDKLDCIDSAKELECLKLWGVCLTRAPKWGVFQRLRTLEIVGATLEDHALLQVLKASPDLRELALLGCEGPSEAFIELERLESCRLDFLGLANCSLHLGSPRLRVLDVQGFSWIRVNPNHCLRSVSISKVSGRVCQVDMGRLEGLEQLSLRGVQWSWDALNYVLQCASEVENLVMKVEFCGDSDRLQPFPQIDLVEFFNNHPKIRRFEIHGAMFAALCQKESLRNLDLGFAIPCLEEVVVTVRSPLNAEQKLSTLESLVSYCKRLGKMTVRISQMRSCQDAADDFFEEICRFAYLNSKVVRIE